MGAENAGHRQAIQMISEYPFPQFANAVRLHARIDNGPARPVAQQPKIDMVQAGQFQRHPHPKDTGRDLLRDAQFGCFAEGIFHFDLSRHELPFSARMADEPSGRHSRYLIT